MYIDQMDDFLMDGFFDSIGETRSILKMGQYKRQLDSLEEEGKIPDQDGVEYYFLKSFVDEQMSIDFPLIARDFLRHEMANLPDIVTRWLNPEDDLNFYEQIFENKILNMMMQSYRNGSQYTRLLFQTLYKTYYKQEYKQFKRFNKFSFSEIESMSKVTADAAPDMDIFARIMFMADVFSIPLEPSCSIIHLFLNDARKTEEYTLAEEFDALFEDVYTHEEFNESLSQIEEWIDQAPRNRRGILKLESSDEAKQIAELSLKYYAYPNDYIERMNDDSSGQLFDFARTLAIMRSANPEKEYTFEDVQKYHVIFTSVGALSKLSENVNNWLGRFLSSFKTFDDDECIYKPVNDTAYNSATARPVSKKASSSNHKISSKGSITSNNSSDEIESLKNMIEELRGKLHTQEQETRHYKNKTREDQKILKEKDALLQKYEKEHLELVALRNHVYQSTEEDFTNPSIDQEEMEEVIAGKKIVIIGGHDNWSGKLKNMFPNWVFVKPHVSGSIREEVIRNADYIFFFTDCICHSNYHKFMNVIRADRLPFGYIHTINIAANVKQIYDTLTL